MTTFKITNQEEKDECLMWVSDLYKEVYGFRPRGYNWDAFSFQELTDFINDLFNQADKEREYEEKQAQIAENVTEALKKCPGRGLSKDAVAMHFLSEMLILDPHERVRPVEHLAHPWLREL